MRLKRKHIVIGSSILALGAAGAGVAVATSDDGEGHLTGPAADQAKAAALKVTGGGTANAVERDSEHGGTFEVEVTKPDGKTVDVRLDENYKLVVIDGDNEGSDGSD
jgi:hypothetical protein